MTNTLGVSNAAPSDPVCSPSLRDAPGHTAGPWVSEDAEDHGQIFDPNGKLIAMISTNAWDAALIAAAPCLLAALRRAVTILERLDTLRHLAEDFPALDEARAAIAKAGSP